MDQFLSKLQIGFRNGFSVQHCLLSMPKKQHGAIDKGKIFGGLLENLCKVFDCLPNELTIAKLNAYRFILTPARPILYHLLKSKQKNWIILAIKKNKHGCTLKIYFRSHPN